MKFERKMGNYTGWIDVSHDGQCVYGADVIEKSYQSLDQLEKALAVFDLKARKTFSNPIAYITERWKNTIIEVEVTSFDDDAVWVKKNGKREKVSRNSVFANQEALVQMQKIDLETQESLRAQWSAVPRWEPLP